MQGFLKNPCTVVKPLHAGAEPLRPAEVERLRGLLRKARAVLVRQGWSEDEIGSIGPAIKASIDAGEVEAVRNWAMWLGKKVMTAFDGVAVVPVLSFDTERRIADRKWAKEHQA